MFSMAMEDGPKATMVRVLKAQISSGEQQLEGTRDEALKSCARGMLMQFYYGLGSTLCTLSPADRLILLEDGAVEACPGVAETKTAEAAKAAKAEGESPSRGGVTQEAADAAVYAEAARYLRKAIESAPGQAFPEAEADLAALLAGAGDDEADAPPVRVSSAKARSLFDDFAETFDATMAGLGATQGCFN